MVRTSCTYPVIRTQDASVFHPSAATSEAAAMLQTPHSQATSVMDWLSQTR